MTGLHANVLIYNGSIAALDGDLFTIPGAEIRIVQVAMNIVGSAVRYQRLNFECP